MAHRKGEKEALRRQREEREAKARAEQRRKRLVGFGAAGTLVLAAVVIVFVLVGGGGNDSGPGGGSNVFPEGGEVAEQKVFDVEEAASAAGCELTSSESRGEKDRVHTQSTDQTVKYRDNPPTLGSHWPPGFEAQDGLYGKAPADESLVHTLEHGRVIFWVKPSLPKTARESLRALFDEDTYQLVMVPRQDMPYAVAATAWNRDPVPGGTGRTLGCDEWTPEAVDALRAFRDQHRSNGPEPVP